MTNQSSSTLIYLGMWKGKIVAGIFNIPNRGRYWHVYTSCHGGSAALEPGREAVSRTGALYFPLHVWFASRLMMPLLNDTPRTEAQLGQTAMPL